ncbi:MAG TPA: DUF3883 domain-containing protein [Terriglobales bacterium]|nr:DUF3883 domain-containing protein [Terriglobales bacterium]
MAHPEPALTPQTESKPLRVLFARIGSMTFYAGPQPGDERPKGGGRYNKNNVGHELFNFADFGGRLYGFARAKSGRISLEQIETSAASESTLTDVLVVFVAQQKIIGWYHNAVVHRTSATFASGVATSMRKRLKQAHTSNFRFVGYSFEAPTEQAVLLPEAERTYKIPGTVKHGFGQSNVRYPYQKRGKGKPPAWMMNAISYVQNYDKENLLTNPNAANQSEQAAVISQERGAGFQSNAVIRKAIEEFAMSKARSVLTAKGYRKFQDTSKFKPYDYICQRDSKRFFVEVKGTQTSGKTLILTKGEVDHIRHSPSQCILVLVHGVSVSGTQTIRVGGGLVQIKELWNPDEGDLIPISYSWRVS